MYVRMARFEGGSPDDVRAESDLIRKEIEAAKRGESTGYFPPGLARVTSRVQMMVDAEAGSAAVLMYCDTREQAAEVDRILSGMDPRNSGWGERVSADIYEVTLDESPRLRQAA